MVVEVQRSNEAPSDVSTNAAVTKGGNGQEVSDRAMAFSGGILGMQHKLSDSWKTSYDTDYPAMAEDSMDTTNSSLTNGIGSNTAGSIVNGLLRKANGFVDGMCVGGGGNELEQKIQKLRAEKEAGEISKCPASIHNDQDSPIDFSVKRRSSFSGSLTDDSQASSSSPSHVTDYSAMSPHTDLGSMNHNGDIRRVTPSPDMIEDQKQSGHNKIGALPTTTMPPLLNGIGVYPGLPSNLLGNGSAMNTFSQMAAAAAFADPRNKKNSRPFKAYPKEALQMPLGFFGIPGMSLASIQQSMESGMFSGMNNEDLINLYNQQLQVFRDKQLSASGQNEKASPPSQIQTTNGNHQHHQHQQQNHHHHQQHHHRLSSPSSMNPPPTTSSMSPPHINSDHLRNSNNTPSSTFPPPIPSTSMNATLVSSTSSFAQSNSRKRPRSLPDEQKDAAYWERRRKNNDAAKRSRDARRAKEDEIAIRAALLEQENLKLRVEVAALKTETARLRCLLYNS